MMDEKTRRLLLVAREIIELNEQSGFNLALAGSLLLRYRGIKTRRPTGDIDFIVNDYAGNCKVPIGAELIDKSITSDGTGMAFMYMGVKIDIMSSNEANVYTINGIRCGSIDEAIKAKMKYANEDLSEESRQKHITDLEFMGYDPLEFIK